MNVKSIFLAAIVMSVIPAGAWADEDEDEDKGFTTRDIKKGGYAFSFDGDIIGVGPVAASGPAVRRSAWSVWIESLFTDASQSAATWLVLKNDKITYL